MGEGVYETAIRNAIIDYIRMFPRKGVAWSQYNGAIYDPRKKCFRRRSSYSLNGVPDIIGIWCHRPLFIEVKRPGGIVSADQNKFVALALHHNAIAFVCYDLLTARAKLDSFDI